MDETKKVHIQRGREKDMNIKRERDRERTRNRWMKSRHRGGTKGEKKIEKKRTDGMPILQFFENCQHEWVLLSL